MKKLNILLILLIIVFSSQIIYSQISPEWFARYNGTGNGSDYGRKLAIDNNGDIIVIGESMGISTSYDYLIIKYNPQGSVIWEYRYNGNQGTQTDYPVSLQIDNNNFIYVTGKSAGMTGDYDFLTLKLNPGGGVEWVVRYNDPDNKNDEATSIAIDSYGNVLVTGYININNMSDWNFCTIKYNSAGAQQWVRIYNYQNSIDMAWGVTIDRNNYIYVSGESQSDYLTIKYSQNGDALWVRRFNGNSNGSDYMTNICVDKFCNIYVTGYSEYTFPFFDICVVKYDSSGIFKWAGYYNSIYNKNEWSKGSIVDTLGNVYVAGISQNNNDDDFCLVKFNNNGNVVWSTRYNGPGNDDDDAYSIVRDSLDNIYITGNSWGLGSSMDYCTIKYNSSGIEQWNARYNYLSNSSDYPRSMGIDHNLNLYITGYSVYSYNTDILTIKYSHNLGISKISSTIPGNFQLYPCYPNPFNPSTKIKLDIPANRQQTTNNTQLIIYDILGRELATLVNEQLKPGTYSVDWNATDFPSGIYFYSLQSGDHRETRKMVLIR